MNTTDRETPSGEICAMSESEPPTDTKQDNEFLTEYCNCCERKLNPRTLVNLELNNLTGEYRDSSMPEFPEAESQGWFAFGRACAKKVLREQAARAALAKGK